MTRRNGNYRAGLALGLIAAFLVTWVNLAVGIAGDEDNPVNLSFFMLIAVAVVGVFAADFQARGMARTFFSVAALQVMLGFIVSTGPVAAREPSGAIGLFALNGLFALLWLISGALFARASARHATA